jgi:O-antigen ligase
MNEKEILGRKSVYLKIVWLVMATSGIVIIEPAPVDIGIIVLFILGLLFSEISLKKSVAIPYTIIFLFIFANVISFFVAYEPIHAFRYTGITIYLIISWLFFIGFVNVHGERAVKVIFLGYAFAALLSSFLAISAYFSLIPAQEMFVKYGRVKGLFKDPNVYGPFMIPIALYALIQIEATKKFYRIGWLLLFLISSLSVLLSYSRAAWGSYALALVAYFIIRFLMAPNVKLISRYMFLCGAIVAALFFITTIPQVKATLATRSALQDYDNVRFSKQEQSLDIAMHSPLGIGSGQSEIVINYATHNSYLRVWLENGFLGITCYVLLIVLCLIKSIRCAIRTKNPLYAMAAAAIIAIIVNSFVVDTVHWRHAWLVFAIPWFSHPTLYREAVKQSHSG